ncbi:putative family 9 glycosyl hydrolase [Microthyrium microscopicum]|uniref:cellulase n=1 Tax=Microthyrium microscopicum TaxID=703497 RepID=A0A6A6TZV2_9PEZI|nr:putative family 9 glycosyl hydrolase [Microthyrium microscopicum]
MLPFVILTSLAAHLLLVKVHAQASINTPYTPPPASQGQTASAKDTPNRQWANLLGNSLYFYDIQRSGQLPQDFRVSWRNNSVPDDGKDVNIDLSGGYFDAGNYIKATLPLCWVLTQMAWSGLSFGHGYNAAAQTPYLDRALRQGLDWILQASSVDGEVVVFIGKESTDNVYFGGDQNIPTNDRPSYKITRDNPGTDVTAICAAALAAGSLLYNGTVLPVDSTGKLQEAADMKDEAYSTQLLTRAQSLYDQAQNSLPQQVYQKAVPEVAWAYASSDFDDNLILGGTFLALATGQQNYSQYAQSIYSNSSYGYPVTSGALNWDTHQPAVPVLLVQAALANPNLNINADKYRAAAEVYLDPLVNKKMDGTKYTKGGLFLIPGDSDDASLNPALNCAALAVIYSRLATSGSKTNSYLAWARTQVDYALGNNPAHVVYSVGLHPSSPKNPQSALATGSSSGSVDNIDTDPPTERWVLYGGLVGGPAKDDSFSDRRSDYRETEVALDYVSPMLVLAAHRLAIGDTTDPFYVTMTEPVSSGGDGGLSIGAKVGIAIGCIIGFFLLLAGLAWVFRRSIKRFLNRRREPKHIPLEP